MIHCSLYHNHLRMSPEGPAFAKAGGAVMAGPEWCIVIIPSKATIAHLEHALDWCRKQVEANGTEEGK